MTIVRVATTHRMDIRSNFECFSSLDEFKRRSRSAPGPTQLQVMVTHWARRPSESHSCDGAGTACHTLEMKANSG